MRIQVELPEARSKDLKDLMNTIGVTNYKDVFNTAITLLNWAVKQSQSGRTIAAVDERACVYHELLMPALDYAAKQRGTRGEVETEQNVLTTHENDS